jgi:hypothetical protein
MAPTAVILNDTRGEHHFGCMRVMRHIEEHLAARQISVVARSAVLADWERDRAFLRAMQRSDLVLINGEGTLHHGARRGKRLLEVVRHAARGRIPVVLINALYQDNPPAWGDYLEQLALISARDSWSAAELRLRTSRPVRVVPDLSLAGGFAAQAEPAVPRTLLLVGDSVSRETAAAIHLATARMDAAWRLPMRRTLKASKPHYAAPLRALREAYIGLHAAGARLFDRRLLLARSEQDYIRILQRARLHLTGRFHAVCFSLFTRTPFLAVESNSWKIGALLHDLGLDSDRLCAVADVREHLEDTRLARYSAEEERRIAEGLALCRERTHALFDDIAALARLHRAGAPA